MRVLIDNALSPLVAERLAVAGHDVTHVRDYGLAAAPDAQVFDLATRERPAHCFRRYRLRGADYVSAGDKMIPPRAGTVSRVRLLLASRRQDRGPGAEAEEREAGGPAVTR